MGATADAELDMRRRESEIAQESLRHLLVVLLAGVNQGDAAPVFPSQGVEDRRDLHEVGPGTGNEMDFRRRHGHSRSTS